MQGTARDLAGTRWIGFQHSFLLGRQQRAIAQGLPRPLGVRGG